MRPAHQDLAHLADAGELPGAVDHQQLHVLDAAAERQALLRGLGGGRARGIGDAMIADRALGLRRAVVVDHRDVRRQRHQARHVAAGQHVADEEGPAQPRRHRRRLAGRELAEDLPHRRRQVGDGDARVAQPARQAAGHRDVRRIGSHHRRAGLQRREQVALQRIVRQPREHAVAIVGAEAEGALLPGHEVRQRAVAAEDPLRHAGRAGGERQVGEVVRPHSDAGRRRRAAGRGIAVRAGSGERRPARRRQLVQERRDHGRHRSGGRERDEAARPRQAQRVDQSRRRVRGVEDGERRARFERAEHRPDQARRPVAEDGDDVPRAHAVAQQELRQAVAARLELGVAPRLARIGDRQALGCARRPGREAVLHRADPGGGERLARIGQDGERRARHERQLGRRPVGLGDRLCEQRRVLVEHGGDARWIEQVGVVDEVETDLRPCLGSVDREIELRRHLRRGERRQLEPFDCSFDLREVEHVEKDLEEGCPRQLARRPQLVEQELEGEVVREGVEDGLPHPRDQLAEARLGVQAGTQHERVEEHADQRLDLRPLALRDRRADHHLVLPREAGELQLPGGEQGHEQRRVAVVGERADVVRQGGREDQGARRAAERAHRPARPVERQLEGRRRAGQALPPPGEAPGEALTRQLTALPGRMVGDLNRQLGEHGRAPRGELAVEGREVTHQHADRPAVGDRVVEGEQERPLLRLPIRGGDQQEAEQRPVRQVERQRAEESVQPVALAAAPRRGQGAEVDQGERQVHPPGDPLHRPAGGERERRA